MALIRALENRRKMEEREKKRLEARAERIALKERRAEQRRIELELVEQIRKPVEDMELTDHKPLPEIKRIPGLKLSGQAFADIVMVFEFLHNFGETLGFGKRLANQPQLYTKKNRWKEMLIICKRFFRHGFLTEPQESTSSPAKRRGG